MYVFGPYPPVLALATIFDTNATPLLMRSDLRTGAIRDSDQDAHDDDGEHATWRDARLAMAASL